MGDAIKEGLARSFGLSIRAGASAEVALGSLGAGDLAWLPTDRLALVRHHYDGRVIVELAGVPEEDREPYSLPAGLRVRRAGLPPTPGYAVASRTWARPRGSLGAAE